MARTKRIWPLPHTLGPKLLWPSINVYYHVSGLDNFPKIQQLNSFATSVYNIPTTVHCLSIEACPSTLGYKNAWPILRVYTHGWKVIKMVLQKSNKNHKHVIPHFLPFLGRKKLGISSKLVWMV